MCGLEEFGKEGSSEKTIAILGDRWWPKMVKYEVGKISQPFYVVYICGKSAMSVRMLDVSTLGVGTVLRLESDACGQLSN